MTPSNPLLPAWDYLPDHHVHSNYYEIILYEADATDRAEAWIELWTLATTHDTLYCTWGASDLTTGLHGHVSETRVCVQKILWSLEVSFLRHVNWQTDRHRDIHCNRWHVSQWAARCWTEERQDLVVDGKRGDLHWHWYNVDSRVDEWRLKLRLKVDKLLPATTTFTAQKNTSTTDYQLIQYIMSITCGGSYKIRTNRMWVNAHCDGRPAKYRWRPLFNAAKFGWCPLPECHAVMLPRRETRWN